MLCALQIYLRPDLHDLLVTRPSGRVTLSVRRLLNAAAAGVLVEIRHGWHWATDNEWHNATLILQPLGGGWHDIVDVVV